MVMEFIQIPKCNKKEVKTKLDGWMQFIGNISKEGVNIAMEENKEIRKAQGDIVYCKSFRRNGTYYDLTDYFKI